MATAKLKRSPDSQKSSPIKLLILKKCSFASSFVSLLIDTSPCCCCSSFWADSRLHWAGGCS